MNTARTFRRIVCCVATLSLLVLSLTSLAPVFAGTTDNIYVKSGETYHAISGFESTDTATVANGTVATNVKNNGEQSHKITIGNATNTKASITLNGSYPLSEAAYVQFWIRNTTGADQYLAGMNFLGSGFQYNVPAGKTSLLIADGSTTESAQTWTNIRIGGLGTIRTLCIPANFSGYVRISLAEADLELKAGVFSAANFDAIKTITVYLGNTTTGGDVYLDDLGYIVKTVNQPATNEIYTKQTEEYHAISGFEAEDSVTVASGAAETDIKNNGYQSHKLTVGNATNVKASITLHGSYPLSEAAYMQFWIRNATDSDQYLAGMNFQKDSAFQFNVPVGAQSILIADGSSTETAVTWENVRISGLGTIRTLCIPSGFSGYVRISLAEEDLEIKAGAYSGDNLDAIEIMTMYLGNTTTGGDVYLDDLGYIVDPNAGLDDEPVQPSTNTIYQKPTETYHALTGFETSDTATVANGSAVTNMKNNGLQSHKITVGDNASINATITLKSAHTLSDAAYLQFWVRNTTAADQYLAGMNFLGDGFQFNVPSGAKSFLIADGTTTETEQTWADVRLPVLNTVRSLRIPAGFSGYVRISMAQNDLQIKSGEYNADNLDAIRTITLYLGNTATGGDVYLHDLGYLVDPTAHVPVIPPVQPTTNPIYLDAEDVFHNITGFETEDTATSSTGAADTTVKNNAYRSWKYAIVNDGFVQASLNFGTKYPLSTAPYLQFWVKNDAATTQYVLSVSLQGDGFQYNVPTGAPVWLIADGTTKQTERIWNSVKINGAGTMRGLEIPAGFSGYVRISLKPEHLSPKTGTYNAATVNQTTRLNFYLGNTDSGGSLYMDDLGYITNPNYVGMDNTGVEAATNPIYLGKGDTFHKITGFEAEDRVSSGAGVPDTQTKNNGYQSHKYTVGDKQYVQAALTLNDAYPLSTATSVQFWIKNDSPNDQYLMSISFQGDGSQYNVPAGATCLLIRDGSNKVVKRTFENVRVADAGTVRAIVIPAGFSGYVRVSVIMYDLKPITGRYNAEVFDASTRISMYFGNNAKGGNIYLDDVGYITNPDVNLYGNEDPGKFAKNGVYLNAGDSYHLITGFELDDTDATSPFDRQSHYVSSVKNNGHYSYRFCIPAADYVNATIKFENTDKIRTAEYLQFWISNTSDNNVYMFNPSFSDGSTFQYNVQTDADIFLIEAGTNKITLAEWSSPNLGNFKGRSFVIPMGFKGYVRISLNGKNMTVKKPVEGKFSPTLFAMTSQFTFYLGNIGTARNVYMDDLMLINGKEMEKPEEDYTLDYSMDAVISLYGKLLDEQGQPMKRTKLILNETAMAITDDEGQFLFTGVSMDCHTLYVVDSANKVVAQTAISIMPSDVTDIRGSYIMKEAEAQAIIVNLQMMGAGIRLMSVAEGELNVDTSIQIQDVSVDSNLLPAIILWGSVGLGTVLVAAVVVILVVRARKKKGASQ